VIFAPRFRSWFIIGIDRAWRMSSVFGLKAKPRMAILLPFKVPRCFLASFMACWGCAWFVCSTALNSGGS